MTKLSICNKALRLLGVAKITQSNLDNNSNEQARILNDIYDSVLDEVLSSHPWNFAIKRATLTELGGLITTWAEQGTTNVWQAALTTEPARVEFNGTEGTEKTSIATLTGANQWYWASNILYIYSTSDPDTAYISPGIDAIIPEFEYNNTFSLPSDCLRVIRMKNDDAEFVKEEQRLLTDESADDAKIQYIAQITDTTKFSAGFIMAFAQRLASEMTIPTTNSPTLAQEAYGLYKDKLDEAKGMDAQEGSGRELENLSWEDSRE